VLLVSPAVVLCTVTAVSSLAPLACALQSLVSIHLVLAGSLSVCTLLAVLAGWQRARLGARDGAGAADARDLFLTDCALGLGALSALSIAVMWIAPAMLSPCIA
jgi:hypothetical protein